MSNKRDKSHPRLLPQVLKAVAELRDINGSTAKKIVSRVNELIKRSRASGPKPRNVAMQVRKALNHGIENGLIKYRGGRYKLVFGGKPVNTRTMATRRTAAAPAPRRCQRNAPKGRTRKRTTQPKTVQRRKRKRSSTVSKSSSSEDITSSGEGDATTDSVSSVTVSGSSASSSMNTSDAGDTTSKSAESCTVESKKSDKNNKSSGRCKNKKKTVGMPSSLWSLIKERCGLSTQRGVRKKKTTNNKKPAKKPLRRNKHKKTKTRTQQQTVENSHNSNTNATTTEAIEEKMAHCDNPNCLCNVDVFTDDTGYDSTKHDVQNISYIN